MSFANIGDVFLVSATLSMIGFLGAIVYFFLSRIFASPSMENDARKEVVENIVNVIAIALLLPLLPFYDSFASSLANQLTVTVAPSTLLTTTPFSSNLQPTASSYAVLAASQILDCVRVFFPASSFLHGVFVMVRSLKTQIPSFGIGIGTDMELFGSVMDNLVSMIVFFFFTYQVWVKILAFGAAFGPLFVAIGFPLRSFAPLRGAGGYLIALGLSMYFVMPLTYLYGLSAYWQPGSCEIRAINPTTYTYLAPSQTNFSLVAFAKMILESFGEIIQDVNTFLSDIFIGMCLLPLLAIGVALTTTSIGSSVLGSRLSEIGRGLIKLI